MQAQFFIHIIGKFNEDRSLETLNLLASPKRDGINSKYYNTSIVIKFSLNDLRNPF